MSRAVLRLVEPLGDALEFPEGKSEASGLREITSISEVHSHLQLFLSWPDYSSAFVKIAGEMVKTSITIDQGLSEFDQLFISIDETAFNTAKTDKNKIERVYIEVFGITFGFNPTIQECINEYTEGMPCISMDVPDTITRYNMRGTRRVRLNQDLPISISDKNGCYKGSLIDVSPNAFCIKLSEKDRQTKLEDRITFEESGNYFDAMTTSSINHSIIIKPLTEEATHFGGFFDLYAKFAYPYLKSRFAFNVDPIPEIMHKTGQAKKFASREVSDTWEKNIEDAYTASTFVKDSYIAGYVATDKNGIPIGASNLAKAFIDEKSNPIWAFHGLGVVQDPNLIEHTCSLYKWRVDYLLAKDPTAGIIMWFDGKGKWLEKVYVKFQRLTTDRTKIWPVKHNRYVKQHSQNESLDAHISDWKSSKHIKVKTFERFIAATERVRVGFGVPYLNLGGNLNNVFFNLNEGPDPKLMGQIQQTIKTVKPPRFFVETPLDMQDACFEDYEMFLVETVNRQCSTTVDALRFFSSSLEHSQAVVRRKYEKTS